MGTGISSFKTNLLLLFFFPALAFGVGFGLALQKDRDQAQEVSELAGRYLDYALELKDDMAIIDWAKNMQRTDNVLAFRALTDKKVLAEGGNRDLLTGTFPIGTSYLFPDQILCHGSSDHDPKYPRELFLSYRVSSGTLFWAFFGGLASLLTGLGGLWVQRLRSRSVPSDVAPPKTTTTSKPAKPAASCVQSKQNEPFLLLDKNFVILQASPEAVLLLGKGTSDLSQSHLLDLSPDPFLMQAIEKAEEAHLPQPFPANPTVSITVKPGLEGTFLYFGIPDRLKPPQNL